jgi:hypothetical protein
VRMVGRPVPMTRLRARAVTAVDWDGGGHRWSASLSPRCSWLAAGGTGSPPHRQRGQWVALNPVPTSRCTRSRRPAAGLPCRGPPASCRIARQQAGMVVVARRADQPADGRRRDRGRDAPAAMAGAGGLGGNITVMPASFKARRPGQASCHPQRILLADNVVILEDDARPYDRQDRMTILFPFGHRRRSRRSRATAGRR